MNLVVSDGEKAASSKASCIPTTRPELHRPVRSPFYDGLIFHRVIPVRPLIHGGCPEGTMGLGPGRVLQRRQERSSTNTGSHSAAANSSSCTPTPSSTRRQPPPRILMGRGGAPSPSVQTDRNRNVPHSSENRLHHRDGTHPEPTSPRKILSQLSAARYR